MAKYVNITADDTIIDTTKVTTGLFEGGVGTILGSSLATSSLATSQNRYYYNMQKSSADQFSVAYGHKGGSGSADANEGNNIFGQTRAVYKQFASMLLPYGEVETGFVINSVSQSDCYFITFERARMKDRVNRKNWTLTLSGSDSASVAPAGTVGEGATISLTDNSRDTASVASAVGPRYEIISGTLGTPSSAGYVHFGYFYPNVGVMVLSQQQLSASIPGTNDCINSGSPHTDATAGKVGFARDTDVGPDNSNMAGKLVNSILLGGDLSFRSEEDQTSVAYFCRAKARDFNFSNNPTFVSGSDYGFSNPSFEGNPQTFISTVGLYNTNDELVAVGRLSTPIQKNYQTEATIKVKLTY